MIKPQVCSRCGSENIWRVFSHKEGDDKHAMMVTCKSCGYDWLEHYETRLVAIELVHFYRKKPADAQTPKEIPEQPNNQ